MKHKVTIIAVFVTLVLLGVVTREAEATVYECAEIQGLAEMAETADIVFEGHQVSAKFIEVNVPLRGGEDDKSYNFNAPGVLAKEYTYKVEKAWKGVTKEQEVKVLFPIFDKKDEQPNWQTKNPEVMEESRIFSLNEADRVTKHSRMKRIELPNIFKNSYVLGLCNNVFDITPENTKILQKKFPQGAVQ